MQNAWVAKSSIMPGLKGFIGPYNNAMNHCILQLCKEFPLSVLAFPKQYMMSHGANDLFHLKSRIIRNVAENIVRYDMLSFMLIYCLELSIFVFICLYIYCLELSIFVYICLYIYCLELSIFVYICLYIYCLELSIFVFICLYIY
jgi:hypothetical protein